MANEDAEYLRWIRTQSCRGCGRCAPSEAHHAGKRGLGQRAHDHTAIPLCRDCHRAWHDCRAPFAGWARAEREAWAEAQIAVMRATFLDPNHREEIPW
jgi:hypothetical protein